MNIYLEIFGYCGTALVLFSMMMTSVVKLRVFNAAGSLISMIYAYVCNTWPVVLLNLGLLIIQIVQLIRLHRVKVSFCYRQIGPEDGSLAYFLEFYADEIRNFFPNFRTEVDAGQQVHMVYRDTEPVGVLIGTQTEEGLSVELDYAVPKYRDCSIAMFLFDELKKQGVKTLIATADTDAHRGYLKKMGFVDQADRKIKQL